MCIARISDVINLDDNGIVDTGVIEQITSVLGQKSYRNIILSGKSGVGKTADIYNVVRIKFNETPDADSSVTLPLHVITKTFWILNNSELFTGTAEEIRDNFNEMVVILSAPGDHVLVIEDTNDFLTAIDEHCIPGLVSQLMNMLVNRAFQCILLVRENMGVGSQLNDVLNCHSDIEEQFTVIQKEPAEESTTQLIADSYKSVLEGHHDGLIITDEAITEAVSLTYAHPTLNMYLREQPARTLRFLDRAASHFITLNASQENREHAVREIQVLTKEIITVESLKLKAVKKLKEHSDRLRQAFVTETGEEPSDIDFNVRKTSEIKSAEQDIAACDSDIVTLTEEIKKVTASVRVELSLDVSKIKQIFSTLSGIPSSHLDDTAQEKVLNLERRMLEQIYGQEHAIKTVCGAIKRSAVQLNNPEQPIGSFVFVGSSGVGKTYLAEVLAEILFDDPSKVTSFDMSEYMTSSTVTRLIGTTQGFVGYGSGGALTSAVRKDPHQVILLDEIEKAHADIFTILLQVLDKGRLTDELGTVDFSNVIFIMTTNLAQELSLQADIAVDSDDTRTKIISSLREIFPQELINRVDGYVLFKALQAEHIKMIVEKKLRNINKTLTARDMCVTVSSESIDYLIEDRYVQVEGSRQILKFIGAALETPLSDIILENPKGGITIEATYLPDQNAFGICYDEVK